MAILCLRSRTDQGSLSLSTSWSVITDSITPFFENGLSSPFVDKILSTGRKEYMWTRRQVEKNACGQEDKWTRKHADKNTRGQEDKWTRKQVDKKTSGQDNKWTM